MRKLLPKWVAFGVGVSLAAAASAQTGPSHAPDIMFHDGFEGVAAGPFSDADAARFLAQATFGPTDADIHHLRAIGYQAWLAEQFAATPTLEMSYLNWIGTTLHEQIGQNNRQEAWFLGALGGPDPQNNNIVHTDQLRQRMAFALSEIMVVSDQNTTLNGFAPGVAYYYDILASNAFGNYRTLLEQVTKSPAMGVYLNMMGNQRANAALNIHPDENYAREINQLFSIGLVMLNPDGTVKLSGSGQPIPTYTQSTVSAFAHVFTGWNWADCDANGSDNFNGCGPDYTTGANFLTPMVAFDTTNPLYPAISPSYHDNGTRLPDDISNKQLLSYPGAASGGVLANGGTAQSDLSFALDNVYNHPNVAPFISKQLIQRLVTSNPSPAYVQRVATVFNNNRQSQNQLQSVAQAILLDPESRNGQWQSPDTFGKLREPLLRLTHLWRAMGARHACGQNLPASGTTAAINYANQPYRYGGNAWNTADTQYGSGVAQASLDALTVFNFFKPSFLPPGEMVTRGLLGPEFQINTDSIISNSSNAFENYALNSDIADACGSTDQFGDVKINSAQDFALAGSGSGGAADPSDRLVDAYSTRFMSGQMSPFMRQTLISYLNVIDSTWANGGDWRQERIKRALYLIHTSPEYVIQK
ncbi:DUF1800 domain-containing protein [Dokdonella soli]|uniref:DUF1800 family protein n=1 Tax=Dokdonella soli TaxID=529810 RepID=A0ABP3TL72_9GAMM